MAIEDIIRIFVGCSANSEDAESQAVLEYTLRTHASQPIELTWMRLSKDPHSPFYCDREHNLGWRTERWATPFSAFRWAVPELCNFSGKAIYMDSDIIVCADIAELWRQEFKPGKVVLAKGKGASWRYCVSMWDCKAASEFIAPVEMLQRDPSAHGKLCQFFAQHPELVQAFIGNWNCLDGEEYRSLKDPQIKAIHYTSMRHQPHLKHAIPRLANLGMHHWFDGTPAKHWRDDLQTMFDRKLAEAKVHGYPVHRYENVPLFGAYHKAKVGGIGEPSWARPYKEGIRR